MSQAIEQGVHGRSAEDRPAEHGLAEDRPAEHGLAEDRPAEHGPAEHGRPAARAAALLAAALSLTVIGMALAYAVVLLVDS